MKIILILLAFILGCRGIGILKCPILKEGRCPDGNEITYWLSTSSSKVYQVKLDLGNLKKAPFLKPAPLKIYFHGYTNDRESPLSKEIINGYKSRGRYNVVVVDWSTYCKPGCYIHATKSVKAVGVCAAQFVLDLLKAHPFIDYHLMGHSLGAHVAAWASMYLPGLPRLTKLDPANPLFPKNRTQRGAAKFIDVYQSNGCILGQKDRTGHANIVFNDGTYQTGCKCDILCSHIRCVKYFLESINKTMMAFPCTGWKAFITNKCPMPKYADLVHVGERIDWDRHGDFMVFTRDTEPFILNGDVYTCNDTFQGFKRSQQDCPVTKYPNLVKLWIEGK